MNEAASRDGHQGRNMSVRVKMSLVPDGPGGSSESLGGVSLIAVLPCSWCMISWHLFSS